MKYAYIAGPMSGIPEFNYPMFNRVTEVYRGIGYSVFNPAERDIERHGVDISIGNNQGSVAQASAEHGFDLRVALGEDLQYICSTATTIVMLPGWENSKGARAEHATAVALGLEIDYVRSPR
jgi:hypothetical protein